MATKEKILIDIETNLSEAIKEATNYKKEVSLLKDKIKELKEAGKDNSEEMVIAQAELKRVSKEYNLQQKAIQASTSALMANDGSYQQLYNTWVVADAELKKQTGLLKINADGTYQLTEAYQQAKQKTDNAKTALLGFNEGIKDGRLNVGNYKKDMGEYVDVMGNVPGPVGQAANSVKGFGEQLKGLLLNPVIALFALLSGAVMGLHKALVSSSAGADELSYKMGELKGAVQPVLNQLREFSLALFTGDWKKVGTDILNFVISPFKGLAEVIMGTGQSLKGLFTLNEDLMKEGLKRVKDGVIQATTGIDKAMQDSMKKSAELGRQIAVLTDQLNDSEREMNIEIEKNNLLREKQDRIAKDTTKSAAERLNALALGIEAEKRNMDIEMEHAKMRLDIVKKQIELEGKYGMMSETTEKEYAEARANMYRTETKFFQDTEKLYVLQQKLRAEILADRAQVEPMIEREIKKNLYDVNVEAEAAMKALSDKAASDQYMTSKEYTDEEIQDMKDAMDKKIEIAMATTQLLGSIAEMGDAFGENSAKFQKAVGLAQLAISSGVAIAEAVKSSMGVPFPGNLAAVASATAVVLSNIARAKKMIDSSNIPKPKKSIGGSFSGGGGFSSASFGQISNPVKQSQQTTAQQVAAIQKMPTPVVTVEDINATQMKRVNVTSKANV